MINDDCWWSLFPTRVVEVDVGITTTTTTKKNVVIRKRVRPSGANNITERTDFSSDNNFCFRCYVGKRQEPPPAIIKHQDIPATFMMTTYKGMFVLLSFTLSTVMAGWWIAKMLMLMLMLML